MKVLMSDSYVLDSRSFLDIDDLSDDGSSAREGLKGSSKGKRKRAAGGSGARKEGSLGGSKTAGGNRLRSRPVYSSTSFEAVLELEGYDRYASCDCLAPWSELSEWG